MINIAVLVSGGGTNLQALIDAQARGELQGGRICCVISSRRDAYALERAKMAGIPAITVERRQFGDIAGFCRALEAALEPCNPGLIVHAGFLSILDADFCRAHPHQINVHPALIPAFCGKGMYGLHVHRAVLARGVKLTGASVHFVNEVADGGPIISQKAIAVEPGDTPETLQKRVMEQCEHILLPRAVSLFCQGRLRVQDGRVLIEDSEEVG